MTIRKFAPVPARTSHGEPATAPLFNNAVLARTSRPPMTKISSLFAWVLAGLLAAAAVLAVGYWSYRQMQPRPLFTPASASAAHGPAPAAPASGASGSPD